MRRKRERGQSWEEILHVSAYPGFSEHHTGRAIDLGSPQCDDLTERFEQSAEYAWLTHHARGFGFQLSYPRGNAEGFSYEPWHWCWHAAPPGGQA